MKKFVKDQNFFNKEFILKILSKQKLKLSYNNINKIVILQIILIYILNKKIRLKANFYLNINYFFELFF